MGINKANSFDQAHHHGATSLDHGSHALLADVDASFAQNCFFADPHG